MAQYENRPHLKKIMEQLAGMFGVPGLKEWVQNIEDPLDYDDPNERQAVIQRNLELIQHKIAILKQFSNISPDSATQFVENPANFSYEEWQTLELIKHNLKDYEDSAKFQSQAQQIEKSAQAGSTGLEPPAKKKPKKKIGSYRGWIPS